MVAHRYQPGCKHLVTHGKSKAGGIYDIWCGMKQRCQSPTYHAYPNYGGRGIYVCEEWQSFENFYRDMGERPEGMSLDRIDNDGPYSPENCRWADRRTQQRNRRHVRMIAALGETKSLTCWAEETGLSVGTIWNRLKLGWTEEAAVTTPKLRQRTKDLAYCAEKGIETDA